MGTGLVQLGALSYKWVKMLFSECKASQILWVFPHV